MNCCKVMKYELFEASQIVFNYGEPGDKFYVILEGEVSIKVPTNITFNSKRIDLINFCKDHFTDIVWEKVGDKTLKPQVERICKVFAISKF